MKYDLILADPPWRQTKGGKKSVRPKSSGSELDYKTISLGEIEQILLKAQFKSNPSHCLFMWSIDKYLHQSELMAERLGYTLHARMIWNKVTGIPAAFTIRYGHEYLLWFYKNGLPKISLNERGKIHSVFTEQVKKHSKKPDISYQIIERLYPDANRLELFSRNERNGWDAFGDQVSNSISLDNEPTV